MSLKEVREKRELSQSQLADYSGISIKVIQGLEQHRRNVNRSTLNTLASLASALSCPIIDILTDNKLKIKCRSTKLW